MRIHRFRAEALQATSLLTPRDRAVLDAYTAGVNAGLAALGAPPFEYLVLRQTPRPWREEDTFLVVLSMFVTLQDTEGAYESTLATMRRCAAGADVRFSGAAQAPNGTRRWSDQPSPCPRFPVRISTTCALDGAESRGSTLPPRPQDVVRSGVAPDALAVSWPPGGGLSTDGSGASSPRPLAATAGWSPEDSPATAGRSSPTTCTFPFGFRTRGTALRFIGGILSEESGEQTLIGVTLPGVPAVVVGSNTHVAWGFTNTYADWSDIVLLESIPSTQIDIARPTGGATSIGTTRSSKWPAKPDQVEVVNWTIWGPVLAPDHRGRRAHIVGWPMPPTASRPR